MLIVSIAIYWYKLESLDLLNWPYKDLDKGSLNPLEFRHDVWYENTRILELLVSVESLI